VSFELTDKQLQALDLLGSDAMHLLLDGGSRSGKTFVFTRAVVTRALAAPGSDHAIMRFRFNHLKASIIAQTFPKVMSLCFPGVEPHWDRVDWNVKVGESRIWFGGLDDKERTEKVLGQEHATIYHNEGSQTSYTARNMMLTRLAQKVNRVDGIPLRLKEYVDCNPPGKSHWIHRLWYDHIDPDTKKPVDARKYTHLKMNPGDNRANLAPEYIRTLEAMPQRMRDRFLWGKYADDSEGALWSMELIDQWRELGNLPDMQRVVVAVDPSGASDDPDENNDEVGIVVCGLGTDAKGYVLEDLTLKAGPARWGNVATAAFERRQADVVVAEDNFGGAMVKHVIETARPRTPFRSVTASRGKVVRAEPISSLTETGQIRFAGYFPALEDELCGFHRHGYTGPRSPNRADAMIWAFSELFPGLVKPKEKPKKKPKPLNNFQGSHGWMG